MIEQNLFEVLAPLVSNRCYPARFPQSIGPPTVPAIRYTIVSETPVIDICGDGTEDSHDTVVQVDSLASTYAEVVALKRAIRNTMQGFDPPARLTQSIDMGFDEETKLFRWMQQFTVYGSEN